MLIDRDYGVSLEGRLYDLLSSGAGDGEFFWPEAIFIQTYLSQTVQTRTEAIISDAASAVHAEHVFSLWRKFKAISEKEALKEVSCLLSPGLPMQSSFLFTNIGARVVGSLPKNLQPK